MPPWWITLPVICLLGLVATDFLFYFLIPDLRIIAVPSPTRHYQLQPNTECIDYSSLFREGRLIHYRIGTYGNRIGTDRDQRPITQPLVACIGDSNTFGQGVEFEESYPAILQSLLPENVSVINFGVPGYNAWQSAVMTESINEQLNPEIIIFQICTNDDDPYILPTINKSWPHNTFLAFFIRNIIDRQRHDKKQLHNTHQALQKVIELCYQERIHLILIVRGFPPSIKEEEFDDLHPWVFKTIDVNKMDIHDETDVTTSNHLNENGNKKLATRLSYSILKLVQTDSTDGDVPTSTFE